MNRLLDFVGSQESVDRLMVRLSATVTVFALLTAATLMVAIIVR